MVHEMAVRFLGTTLPCVYPLSDLPGLPLQYLHTASDQILEVEQPGNEAKVPLSVIHSHKSPACRSLFNHMCTASLPLNNNQI